MGAAEVKEVKFEELRDGLNNNSLVYLDVRNRDELRTDGKVVGSVVVPCTYYATTIYEKNDYYYYFLFSFVKLSNQLAYFEFFSVMSNTPVPELEHAFNLGDAEFLDKYGFSKPARDATNVVVGCRSGRRAVTAIGTLEKLGYTTLR